MPSTPDFTLPDPDDERYDLARLRGDGRAVLLVFLRHLG